MIIFTRAFIRIAELYFQEKQPDSPTSVDWWHYVGVLSPKDPSLWRRSTTIVINLEKPEDILLKEMESGTRYEIKRALSKDSLKIIIQEQPTSAEVDTFCNDYDLFAQSKSLRPVYRPRMHSLNSRHNLLLSTACDAQGAPLVQHAHVLMPERTLLLYSASHFRAADDSATRSLIGRANRLLHWEDMRVSRQRGVPSYDFCGVDLENKSPETTRIAQFNKGFGGSVIPSYSRTQAASIKGLIARKLLDLAGRGI